MDKKQRTHSKIPDTDRTGKTDGFITALQVALQDTDTLTEHRDGQCRGAGEARAPADDVTALCRQSWGQPAEALPWRTLSELAADFERRGIYGMARSYWLKAWSVVPASPDRHWCESRAMWCQRREQDGRDRHE